MGRYAVRTYYQPRHAKDNSPWGGSGKQLYGRGRGRSGSGRLPRACCRTATRPAPAAGSRGSPIPTLHAPQRTRAIATHGEQSASVKLAGCSSSASAAGCYFGAPTWFPPLADVDGQVCNSWLCRAPLYGDATSPEPPLSFAECMGICELGTAPDRSAKRILDLLLLLDFDCYE
ncbi:hypothetical protein CFC21_066087 [Triticum aestivum]|uniref:Uncharacterized protein n=3 Tax=Triticum TaxID=4564 RepID=A0A9R1H5T8_WHEAT|nr:hypothetical protein CFC21_002443 [Triticum aestivum]KAF6986518.1 hypothetical protein CFC21_004260 [Triticum aestivum]KAF7059142.1 hypothetical protein CFC21_066085 [Triticum aestivum]KAF7059145.1 hypothetical protein CFC21_066087 [Triticum aestivum]VAI18234.1 unnamed protein product [Triticum turgidum subsp. durum]